MIKKKKKVGNHETLQVRSTTTVTEGQSAQVPDLEARGLADEPL